MKIVFQGDSITDAGRDRRNYHNLGQGYPKFAAELIREAYPDTDFEFINFGISGNRTCELFDRLYKDAIEFQPDIISLFIGINDVWHRYEPTRILTTDEQIMTNYRAILERVKNETNAKIIVLVPYVLDCKGVEYLKPDHARLAAMVKELGAKYADVVIPLDELFDEAMKTQPHPLYYSADGVHPNEEGAKFIAEHYKAAIDKLL